MSVEQRQLLKWLRGLGFGAAPVLGDARTVVVGQAEITVLDG